MLNYLEPNSIVSDGTLKLDDLLCRFAHTLALHEHGENRKLILEATVFAHDMRANRTYDIEAAQEILDELAQKLDALAPPGFFFGVSPCDAACFGVFEYSEDAILPSMEDYYAHLDRAADRADEQYQFEREQEQ